MTRIQSSIPCAVLRGGTSRGVYFRAEDLPEDRALRDRILLRIMGGPDALQIDGIGGGHPLNNKVAIVSLSERDDADVDYLFLQVIPGESRISDGQNCGNILAGVGPFAIESGLLAAGSPDTVVRIHMVNSAKTCELTVETPDGAVNYEGDTHIAGVPESAAPIVCNFPDVAGSSCGALLPTGNSLDVIDGTDATCIDNGMPVVLLRATDFDVTGHESPGELDANLPLKARLEALRLASGRLMNLGDVSDKTVPKMCLVSAAAAGGNLATRTFIPHVCHKAIGVLGAVSVATACLYPDSVAAEVADVPAGRDKTLKIEHPSGSLAVRLVVSAANRVERAGVVRTARLLFRGDACVGTRL